MSFGTALTRRGHVVTCASSPTILLVSGHGFSADVHRTTATDRVKPVHGPAKPEVPPRRATTAPKKPAATSRSLPQPAGEREFDEFVRAIRRAHVALDATSVAAQAELGIARSDLATLELVIIGDRLSAGDIADQLQTSTGTATGVVDRLVAGGYVERRTDPRDRRRVLVSMTPKGRRRFREAFQRRWAWLHQMASELSATELAAIVSFLSRMPEMTANGAGRGAEPSGPDADVSVDGRRKRPEHDPAT